MVKRINLKRKFVFSNIIVNEDYNSSDNSSGR